MPLDRPMLDRTIEYLSRLVRAHAGGIELIEVDPAGVVTLRYTGMCAGCEFRPVTTAAAVRPALMLVEGVTGVRIRGARISAEAEERLAETLKGGQVPRRLQRMLANLP